MGESPQVIPPRRAVRGGGTPVADEQLEALASLMDEAFAIPGTRWRVGLDALIGLIPGVGDLITSAFSFIIVFAAWQRGLPRVTIARMVANVAIDSVLGAMPLAGDVFDAAWKSNKKNVALLKRASTEPGTMHQAKDWGALLLLLLAAAAIIAVPIYVVIWLLRHILG